MNKKIIFASGGTGGHIFPAINLMKYLSKKGYDITLVTDYKGKNFITDHPKFKSYIISADTTINKNLIRKIFSLFVILYSIIKSFFILKKEKPNLIIGFGGYVSFPISFTSRFFNCPLVVYEPNLILGRTNKYLLPKIKKLIVAFTEPVNLPNKYLNLVHKVGPILEENFISCSTEKEKDKKNFSILILGGSQGAVNFGKIIPPVMKMIKDKGFDIEINQQCLKHQKNSLSDFYRQNKIKSNIFEFEKDILSLLLSTDLAISRCGASTLGELIYTRTPFIAVPYPFSTDNHQYLNAKYFSEKNYCWLIEESGLNNKILFNLIHEIILDKSKLKSMKNSITESYRKNAYREVEDIVKGIFKNEN